MAENESKIGKEEKIASTLLDEEGVGIKMTDENIAILRERMRERVKRERPTHKLVTLTQDNCDLITIIDLMNTFDVQFHVNHEETRVKPFIEKYPKLLDEIEY
ncbi:MAG: hypothetical protein GY870_14100 [archaeon]|nr:hypothetical protein [archaeon]